MEKEQQQKLDILLKIYEDSQLQRRHHESSRMTSSSILIALDSAIIIAWAKLEIASKAEAALPILLIALGIFGVLISLSHKDRYDFYWRRGHMIKKYIDSYYCDGILASIDDEAESYVPSSKEEKYHRIKLPYILRHHGMWVYIHAIMTLVGVFMIIL